MESRFSVRWQKLRIKEAGISQYMTGDAGCGSRGWGGGELGRGLKLLEAGGRRKMVERGVKMREMCKEAGGEIRKLFHCVQEYREDLEMCVTGFFPS